MSASHIDWHKKHSIGIASLNYFDDSSKKIIARRELVYCNTEKHDQSNRRKKPKNEKI
jgi:hypothetical protein